MTEEILVRLALEVQCPTCGAPKGSPCPTHAPVHPTRLPLEARKHPTEVPRPSTQHFTCASAHEGKRPYRNHAQAERALQHIRGLGNRPDGGHIPTRTYMCGLCHRWFLTSRPA